MKGERKDYIDRRNGLVDRFENGRRGRVVCEARWKEKRIMHVSLTSEIS